MLYDRPTITLGDKDVLRFSASIAVKKGQWYVGARCKTCRRYIYIAEDKTYGRLQVIGKAKASMPCRHCLSDHFYESHEISPVLSTEDLPSKRPPRVQAATDMPQKIDSKYAGVSPTVGPSMLEERPAAAALIARCITLWSEVEASLASLLATLLRANTEPVVALFLSIESGRQQSKTLDAVATVVLDERDYELFKALLNYKKSAEAQRNNLAHAVFGVHDKIATGVVCVDLLHYTQYGLKIKLHGPTDEIVAAFRSKMYVYELADLERVAQELEDLHKQLGFFTGYMATAFSDDPDKDTWRAARYPQLCAESRIRQELEILRVGQKKKTEAQNG